jgi:hypothetical protein
MSQFEDFKLGVNLDVEKRTRPEREETDPLTPIQSHSTEISDTNVSLHLENITNGIDESLNLRETNDEDDYEDQISDESSISFELYDDEFVREKIISQIKQEQVDQNILDNNKNNKNDNDSFNPSEFLLKYYKYRELNDMSLGLGKLIEGIDNDLIKLVNDNYLSFIDLGKSIDGSLDLIHDIKIDLCDYLKNLKSSNAAIEKDETNLFKLQDSRRKLISLKSIVKRIITLSEMIECFDKLCSKFDKNEECTDMLKELVGLYFGINRMFLKLIKQIKEQNLDVLINNGILLNLSKKMNGLKLEFKSLLNVYLGHLKKSNPNNEDIFEIFKLYQLLNCIQDFKDNL